MTFLIDDLLVRPFIGLLDILHDMALREMYNVEEIQDDLKENRLLYEIGDRSEDEYLRRKAELEARLEEAERAQESLSGRARVIQ
ncbi:protein gvpG [Halobacteriales archaeon QS_5_70_15]|nr:MAG: protein gvpG [Halobacteriales archaeon QS_5_70_15]